MELEEIKRRLENWAKGKKEGPVRMELHPTDKCNLKCIFCWQRKKEKENERELTERELIKIVREAWKLGVKEWIISGGGEPLMRKRETFSVLREIKKYKMWELLTTNGTLLTEKDISELVKIGVDQVQFSIDGPNPYINDFLRPPNSFEKIIKAVSQLRKIRDKYKSTKPYIGFNTIINKLNYNKMHEMIELAYKLGADLVFFEPIYPGYSNIPLSLTKEELRKLPQFVKVAKKTADKLKIDTNVEDFLEIQLADKSNLRKKMKKEVENIDGFIGAPCFRPWYLMGIKASGFAGCCSTFEIGEFIFGKSLKEIWFGKLFNKLRRNMLKKNPPSYCEKCSIVVLMENRMLRRMLHGGKD